MIGIWARIYEQDGDRVPNTNPTIEIDVDKYIESGNAPLDFVVYGKTLYEWIDAMYAVDFLAYNTRTGKVVSVQRLRPKWRKYLCTAEEENPENPNAFGLVEHIWGQVLPSGRVAPCFVVG